MIKRLVLIFQHRKILLEMAVSEFKVKYASSVLGIFWAVINPVLLMSAITFVFVNIFKIDMKNYQLFVLSGILPWIFFSNSLSEGAGALINRQHILRQFNFPREIIPLSCVFSKFINFLIFWVLIYIFSLFFNPAAGLLIPVSILGVTLELLFVSGIVLIFSGLNVLCRDFGQATDILLVFWFWVTPVFYLFSMVPKEFSWIYAMNPMMYYVVYFQSLIFKATLPETYIIFGSFIWAIAIFWLGLFIFSKLESSILKKI